MSRAITRPSVLEFGSIRFEFVLRRNPAPFACGFGNLHMLLGGGAGVFTCEQFRFEHFNTVMSVEIVGGLQLS